MSTVNHLTGGEGRVGIHYTLKSIGATCARGEEDYVNRVDNLLIDAADYEVLSQRAVNVGTTDRFKDVIRTFQVPSGQTPAGFRLESKLEADGLLSVDLVRDIGYDQNGMKRPTGTIFSADSANPYEIAPIAKLLGNLTCNPGIVYDLFLNKPELNIDGFTTRDEVMTEIGRILGPGCDISVELNNPFVPDFEQILDEVRRFEEILTPYRLVVKVPHTGPINEDNVRQLLDGDGRLPVGYDRCATADALRGHNLALRLREHGYRINYTLMFEPYQTNLALQAKPYFINSFIRQRGKQTQEMQRLVRMHELTGEVAPVKELRECLLKWDFLPRGDEQHELLDVLRLARSVLAYRHADDAEGEDGLDSVRHNLKLLRHANLRDAKLIICSMEGERNYPDIDRLLADPEYADVADRVIITAEPKYLARFTSSNLVVSYQRRFMNAASGQR